MAMSLNNQYRNLIRSMANRLITIEDIKKAPETPFAINHSVFGVIKYVQTEAQGISRSPKKTVTLTDPTDSEDGLKVIITRKEGMYHPGNILHIRVLSREQRPRSTVYTAVASDVTEICAFTFDYDTQSDENDSFSFKHKGHRDLCRLLEEWQGTLLLKTSLSALQLPGQTSYTDLVVQVVRKRLMLQSIVLTVWDGSAPVISVHDPYIEEHQGEHPAENWTQQLRPNIQELSQGFAVDVNVWSNEEKSKSVCVHFENCIDGCKLDQDDYLLFLNLEVKKLLADVCTITMHSGHHKGKAARIVRGCSVLGRMFRERMSKSVMNIIVQELSLTFPAETEELLPVKAAKTTVEVVPDRVPASVIRMKELMRKMPPETHISAVFENPVDCLETFKENLSQITVDDDSDPAGSESQALHIKDYAELLNLVIQVKNIAQKDGLRARVATA